MRKARTAGIKVKTGLKVPRITYATLKITPEDDEAYDKAVGLVRNKLGSRFTMYINGEHWASTGEEMEHRSPIDTRIVVSSFSERHT